MLHTTFDAVSRFSPSKLRTSFRRSTTRSSSSTTTTTSSSSPSSSPSVRDSYSSQTSVSSSSSSASTINSIIMRQASLVGLEEERRVFGSELCVLEPRPLVYWGGVEERMGRFAF